MKSMELVQYLPKYFESMLTLHRSEKNNITAKLGIDVGIADDKEEVDLWALENTYIQSGGDFLIGLLDSSVIAMGGFQWLSSDSAELRRMRIQTDLQGQGYGSQLLNELQRTDR